MGIPPSDKGALHVTVANPLFSVAVTAVGLPGTVDGVTGLEEPELGPLPSASIAVTAKV
jgi:hypothetical protein